MVAFSADVAYAYILLGIEPGSSLTDIREAFTNAMAYRFRTQERVATVRGLMEFFAARNLLGTLDDTFADIQKAYREKARDLHPDLNRHIPDAEELLKEVNVAYGIVDAFHRSGKEFFKESEADRNEIEKEARSAARLEAAERYPQKKKPEAQQSRPQTHQQAQHGPVHMGLKYMAASVPRSIRMARLSHLPKNYIIGSWHVGSEGSYHMFDIIMLPEKEFARARIYLSVPNIADASLQRGSFAPTYIVKDVRVVNIPLDEDDPESFARAHFLKEFNLRKN